MKGYNFRVLGMRWDNPEIHPFHGLSENQCDKLGIWTIQRQFLTLECNSHVNYKTVLNIAH